MWLRNMKNYPFSVENYSWRNWQVPIFPESSKLSRNLKIGDRKFKLCLPDIVVRINLTGLKCQSNQLTPTTIQFDEWSWVRASRLVELWITRQNSLSRIIQVFNLFLFQGDLLRFSEEASLCIMWRREVKTEPRHISCGVSENNNDFLNRGHL